ncbi:unnamed protein product [Toxocara canis]|uniref:POP1 domain-containing protein n=1 Tax=Toxocara canis TaxID=6265 RepID=A0A183ULF1_TOXCA|nr:unnamed protein product [Toxocara canis]
MNYDLGKHDCAILSWLKSSRKAFGYPSQWTVKARPCNCEINAHVGEPQKWMMRAEPEEATRAEASKHFQKRFEARKHVARVKQHTAVGVSSVLAPPPVLAQWVKRVAAMGGQLAAWLGAACSSLCDASAASFLLQQWSVVPSTRRGQEAREAVVKGQQDDIAISRPAELHLAGSSHMPAHYVPSLLPQYSVLLRMSVRYLPAS